MAPLHHRGANRRRRHGGGPGRNAFAGLGKHRLVLGADGKNTERKQDDSRLGRGAAAACESPGAGSPYAKFVIAQGPKSISDMIIIISNNLVPGPDFDCILRVGRKR